MAWDKEFCTKWVEALRSGKYQQGSGRLRIGNRFCCLGVACEIDGIKPQEIDGEIYYDGENATLPFKLSEKIGTNCNAEISFASKEYYIECLFSLNDIGLNFAQIADIICYEAAL